MTRWFSFFDTSGVFFWCADTLYYKYKFHASNDDLKKYETLLPIIVRIRKELDDLKSKKPELINEILEPYIRDNVDTNLS